MDKVQTIVIGKKQYSVIATDALKAKDELIEDLEDRIAILEAIQESDGKYRDFEEVISEN